LKKILLHICCAPCSTSAVEQLKQSGFEVAGFFYNPNIHPKKEYEQRASELKKIEDSVNIKVFRHENYEEEVAKWFSCIKGFENEKEGGKRCELCYELRLRKTAEKAKEEGFDSFATTLTISPHKNAKVINAVGERIARETGVEYYPSDFKKKDGFKKSIELSKRYSLKRQNYCGCVFSAASAITSSSLKGGRTL